MKAIQLIAYRPRLLSTFMTIIDTNERVQASHLNYLFSLANELILIIAGAKEAFLWVDRYSRVTGRTDECPDQ